MKIIVGLGNPGKKYERVRHNTGFMLLDKVLAEKNLKWVYEKKFDSDVAKDGETLYVKPQTFMNRSGENVSKVLNFYKLDTDDLLVINDDVDLEFGTVKKQKGKGSAGHRGVQNIIDQLGSNEFERIRVGIGRPKEPQTDTDNWVMGNFTEKELDSLPDLTDLV